ncbi:MAG: hypothetical protein ACHREM_30035 [Polyangiales bacterium]
MFALLSGHDVHSAETVPELLAAIFTVPARSLTIVVPCAHPALVHVVDRALQLRLADRWPDARSMQAAVREAYFAMNGVTIPARVPGVPVPTESLPDDDVLLPLVVAPRAATTAVSLEGRGHRFPRRAALASSFLLAAALGIAGVEHDSLPQQGSRSSEPSVRLLEASSEMSSSPISAPVALVPPEAPTMPVVHRAPSVASTVSVPRVRQPSVYDSRH